MMTKRRRFTKYRIVTDEIILLLSFQRSYVDALLTSGSVAGVETRDTSEEPDNPFTKPIKFKRRIVASDDEDD